MNLNVGCGNATLPGWVNCDYKEGPGVDKVFDAAEPWPFEDECADKVLLSHVLEHLPNWESALLEVHRVLRTEGRAVIKVPYGFNADPGHVRYFLPSSLDVFCMDQGGSQSLEYRAQPQLFEKVECDIMRVIPFRWHVRNLLGLSIPAPWKYKFPIGQRVEIVWVLKKVSRPRKL